MKTRKERLDERNARRAAKGKPPIAPTLREALAQADEKRAAKAKDQPRKFPALGVQITTDGQVQVLGTFGGTGRVLGPAAGAHAEVIGERQSHRVATGVLAGAALGPAGLLAAGSKRSRGGTLVALANGETRQKTLDGNFILAQAHKEAAQFNAAVAVLPAAMTGGRTAERLTELAGLRDAGLLSEEEHAARRAAILEAL